MIRAHLATFPPRAEILMQTVATILPQVDRLFICLNGYPAVPPELADLGKVQALIPDHDLKDTGKFAFSPAADDLVFTIDDDILYPPDYVARTIAVFDRLDPAENVLGYQGNAWVAKAGDERPGWRNFLFHRPVGQIIKADVLGTGTACLLGRNLPALDQVISAAGFVDSRFSRLQTLAGRSMWVLPRGQDELRNNMRDDLRPTALFTTVHGARAPALLMENRQLLRERSPHSGLRLEQVMKRRAKDAAS